MKKVLLFAVCLCGLVGCSDDSATESCTAGEKQCSSDGLSILVCQENNEWVTTPCRPDEACKLGECVGIVTDDSCDKSAEICGRAGQDFDETECRCVEKTCDKSAEICAKDCRMKGGFYKISRNECKMLDQTKFLLAINSSIYDANKNETQLRGVVLPNVGTAQFDAAVSSETLTALKEKLNVNMIRFTFVPQELNKDDVAQSKVEENIKSIKTAIDNASELGIYSIVDWGIIRGTDDFKTEPDPLVTLSTSGIEFNISADEFFTEIASYSQNNPFVLFEIANEPVAGKNNSETWSAVKEYSEIIIPIIRKYSQNIIIAAGKAAAVLQYCWESPISYFNIAYTYHNYPYKYNYTSDKADKKYGEFLETALQKGLTIISTEMAPVDPNLNHDGNTADKTSIYLDCNWKKFMDLYCDKKISFAWFKLNFPWSSDVYVEWSILKPINASNNQEDNMTRYIRHFTNLDPNADYECPDKSKEDCEKYGSGAFTRSGYEFYRVMKGEACQDGKYVPDSNFQGTCE